MEGVLERHGRGARLTIDAYLDALERRLPVTGRVRTIPEVREHLRDAAARHRAAGVPIGEAEIRATGEFGDVDEVARRLAAELAVRETRLASAVALTATALFVIPLYVVPETSSPPPAPWIEIPSDVLSLHQLALGLWLVAGVAAVVSAVLAWTSRLSWVPLGLAGVSLTIAATIGVCVLLVVRWHSYTPATPNWALAAPLAAACLAACASAAVWATSRRRPLRHS